MGLALIAQKARATAVGNSAPTFDNFLDNGASFISTPHRADLVDIRPIASRTIEGLGMPLTSREAGTMVVKFRDTGQTVSFHNVLVLPESRVRLFSESQLARHGIRVDNDYTGLVAMPGQNLQSGSLRKFLCTIDSNTGNRTLITAVNSVSEVYPLTIEILSRGQPGTPPVALPAPAAGEEERTAGAAAQHGQGPKLQNVGTGLKAMPFPDRLRWHVILNHAPLAQIRKAQKNETVLGLEDADFGPSTDDAVLCDACIRGALTADPFRSVDREAKAPLELLHVDLFASEWGDSIHGHSYGMLVKDEYTQNAIERNLKTRMKLRGS